MKAASFTAAQIAAALALPSEGCGVRSPTVREDVQAACAAMRRQPGLRHPSRHRCKQAQSPAKARGYRNGEHLLADAPSRFESPVPISQLSAPIQRRCIELRDALARPLADHAMA